MRRTSGAGVHTALGGITSDQHHSETHAPESHSDTLITGAELETLSDGSDADALHNHPLDFSVDAAAAHEAAIDTHHAEIHSNAVHSGVIGIHKSSDESVVNSTALQNDDHFSFPIGANETWVVMIDGPVDIDPASDIKFAWSLPTDGTYNFGAMLLDDGGNAIDDFEEDSTGVISLLTSSQPDGFKLSAVLKNAANAGTAVLQWAQASSSAFACDLLEGGRMIAIRVE